VRDADGSYQVMSHHWRVSRPSEAECGPAEDTPCTEEHGPKNTTRAVPRFCHCRSPRSPSPTRASILSAMNVHVGALAAVAAQPAALPANIDPIGVKVGRALQCRRTVFDEINNMPSLAAVRAMLTPNELAAAARFNRDYNARKQNLVENTNIIDESGTGDPSGNAHRPLDEAAADVGVTAALIAKQSVFGPRTMERLLDMALACSCTDADGELLIAFWEVYTKEVESEDDDGNKELNLVDRKITNSFSNASGAFIWRVNTLEGRPMLLNYDLLRRLCGPGDDDYDSVMDSFEPRRKHLWRLRDFLAVCAYPQLRPRNFMYVAGETSPYYYLIQSEYQSLSAGAGPVCGSISSIGARLDNNWVCYAPVGFAASMMDNPFAPLHPPTDSFQFEDTNGDLVGDGEYFYFELKLWGGVDSIAIKGRSALESSCVTSESVHAASVCCTQLDQTKFMEKFRELSTPANCGKLMSEVMPGATSFIVGGSTSPFVARIAAYQSLSVVEKLRMLMSSGYDGCIEVNPLFNNANAVVLRQGPAPDDPVEVAAGGDFFDRIFDQNGNSPLDIALNLLSARFQAPNLAAGAKPSSERNFLGFLTDIVKQMERNGDGQGNGRDFQIVIVDADQTERRFRGIPPQLQELLLKTYVKGRLRDWSANANVA